MRSARQRAAERLRRQQGGVPLVQAALHPIPSPMLLRTLGLDSAFSSSLVGLFKSSSNLVFWGQQEEEVNKMMGSQSTWDPE